MSQTLGQPQPKYPKFQQEVTVKWAGLHGGHEYESGISMGYSWNPKRNIFMYNVLIDGEVRKDIAEYQLV